MKNKAEGSSLKFRITVVNALGKRASIYRQRSLEAAVQKAMKKHLLYESPLQPFGLFVTPLDP